MRTIKSFIVLLMCSAPFIYAQLPQPDHIVIVIEENKNYIEIIGSSNAPYINSLAADSMGALFTNFYAETHPSQPNYLWLFSGSNQGVVNDNVPADTPFATPNLGASLLDSGYTFYAYNENLPYAGYEGAQSGDYVRKHNPMTNWQEYSVPISNGISFTKNVPFTAFPGDYTNLPAMCYVIPNLQHDMHNGTIAQGDSWLHNNLDGYVQWAKTHNSLFVFTFDEDNNNGYGNRIVTLFVGAMLQNGNFNSHYNHNNLLRTFEDMYGLRHAGLSADSSAITGCWNFTTPVELSSFNAKGNNDGKVILSWSTSTETNNNIFVIERKNGNNQFSAIGSIPGNGTSSIPHTYSYTDNAVKSGLYFYRLKQVDFNGSFSYSNTINVNVTEPASYNLEQNYPNPFNPSTTIEFSLPENAEKVTLSVYSVLGEKVAELVNSKLEAGSYNYQWNAKNLASGMYIYELKTEKFISVKKMLLLR